jgi:hypothetical protein
MKKRTKELFILVIIVAILVLLTSCGGEVVSGEADTKEKYYTTIYFLNCDGSAMDSVTVPWEDWNNNSGGIRWIGHDDRYNSVYDGRYITKAATEKEWITDLMDTRKERQDEK